MLRRFNKKVGMLKGPVDLLELSEFMIISISNRVTGTRKTEFGLRFAK